MSRGRIEVICGCMFAGKTTLLIERLQRATAEGLRVVAIKHANDDRYDVTQLMTHDQRGLPCVPAQSADEVFKAAAEMDVVGIDEGHFFGRTLEPVCVALKAAGKRVIVAGLDHDAWGQPFPPFPALKEEAASVEVRTMPCQRCGRPARHSQRMVAVTSPTMVGGLGDYEPRCGRCFEPLPGPAPEY